MDYKAQPKAVYYGLKEPRYVDRYRDIAVVEPGTAPTAEVPAVILPRST